MFFARRFAPKRKHYEKARGSACKRQAGLQGYTTRVHYKGTLQGALQGALLKYLWVSPPNIINYLHKELRLRLALVRDQEGEEGQAEMHGHEGEEGQAEMHGHDGEEGQAETSFRASIQ